MTKLSKMAMVAVLAVAACGGGKKDDTMVSGGDTAVGAGGAVAGAGTPCAQEIALTCGEGMADGCAAGLTIVHVCVAAAATAGPPCEQEIALDCPAGQVDACLQAPAPAATHVCVAK